MLNESNLIKILRAFLGATFILSAVAKIYSLDFFDELVAKQLIGDDYFDQLDKFFWVQWLTRILIAGEFMLGVAVLQERHLKKIVLPAMIGLLVVFTLQVIFEAEVHNKGYVGGNCGCFGEVIPFDNRQTIIKNIVLVLMSYFVFKKYRETGNMNLPPVIIPYIVGAVTLFTLSRTFTKSEKVETIDMAQFEISAKDNFEKKEMDSNDTSDSILLKALANKDTFVVLDKVKNDLTQVNNETAESNKISEVKPAKASIFDGYKNFSGGVVKNLEQGTHLICLFSFSCGHCQQAYKDILEARKKGAKTGEVYIIGYGSEFEEKNFWNATGGKSPFIRIDDEIEFARLRQGADFPKIIAKKDGLTKKEWVYSTYSKESLFNYFGLKMVNEVKIPNTNEINLDNNPKGGLFIEEPNSSPSIFDK